jgi:ABC-type multidrug transport system ATPase subunit
MLSEGQKKMLTIALSLIYDPDILICDEPTFALDRYNARRIMDILRSLTYENKTVIFTTHDIRFALEYADHIIFLENGELKFNGYVYDFIKRIGELNIALPAAFESLSFEELRNFIIEIRGNNEI